MFKTEIRHLDEVANDETNILTLPNEILENISNYLSHRESYWKLGFTCLRWHETCNKQLRSRIPIYDDYKEDMSVIARRLKKMSGCHEVTSNLRVLLFDPEAECVKDHLKIRSAMFYSIKKFDYGRYTDIKIKETTKACNKLMWLSLPECRGMSEKGLYSIASNCKELEVLTITQATKITDGEITYAAFRQLKNIRLLDFSGCTGLSDKCITILAKNCQKIKTLTLASCVRLSDVGIMGIAKNLKCLDSLDISCTKLTDLAVEYIAEAYLPLTALNLSCVTQITDMSCAILGEKMKMISTLSLQCCDKITDKSILSLAHCKTLKYLDVRSCWQITRNMLKKLPDNLTVDQDDEANSLLNFVVSTNIDALY